MALDPGGHTFTFLDPDKCTFTFLELDLATGPPVGQPELLPRPPVPSIRRIHVL